MIFGITEQSIRNRKKVPNKNYVPTLDGLESESALQNGGFHLVGLVPTVGGEVEDRVRHHSVSPLHYNKSYYILI